MLSDPSSRSVTPDVEEPADAPGVGAAFPRKVHLHQPAASRAFGSGGGGKAPKGDDSLNAFARRRRRDLRRRFGRHHARLRARQPMLAGRQSLYDSRRDRLEDMYAARRPTSADLAGRSATPMMRAAPRRGRASPARGARVVRVEARRPAVPLHLRAWRTPSCCPPDLPPPRWPEVVEARPRGEASPGRRRWAKLRRRARLRDGGGGPVTRPGQQRHLRGLGSAAPRTGSRPWHGVNDAPRPPVVSTARAAGAQVRSARSAGRTRVNSAPSTNTRGKRAAGAAGRRRRRGAVSGSSSSANSACGKCTCGGG